MSFVKSILQQWRDRNLKKNTYSDSEQLIVSDIPGTDIAEQHLLEALARQINDAVNNGKTISSLNVEIVYEQLAESLDRFKQESLNTARNELSEKWREEESRRIAEIKNLQEQNAELSHNYTEAQKRHAGAERLRKTLSERIHDLENELITVRDGYEREIEEKLRQINKIKAQSLGISYDEPDEKTEEEVSQNIEDTDTEKIFDCRSVSDERDNEAIVIKHRYASLYNKLNKAQNALQELRKENRNIMKRDSRHQQRIKDLQETTQKLRKEVRKLTEELDQALRKAGKKSSMSPTEPTSRHAYKPAPGLTSLIFPDDTAENL